jgi:hypothetical protein
VKAAVKKRIPAPSRMEPGFFYPGVSHYPQPTHRVISALAGYRPGNLKGRGNTGGLDVEGRIISIWVFELQDVE